MEQTLSYGDYGDDAGGILSMIAAQVHATLALVEQQRIANLIALAEFARREFGNYAGEAGGFGTLLSYGETPESNMRVRDDVAAALGIREVSRGD